MKKPNYLRNASSIALTLAGACLLASCNGPPGPKPPPKPEDEGLSTREIRWIPLMVPFGALTLLLAAAAALSTA